MSQSEGKFAKGSDDDDLHAWKISEKAFPSGGSNEDKLKFFVNYAVLAPSSHNTQPWLFDISNSTTISLYADRTRALPVVDPEDRELTISCGAGLNQLLLAIRHFGYDYKLKMLPIDSDKEDLLAEVTIGNIGSKPVVSSLSSPEQGKEGRIENLLFEAIVKCWTNRTIFLNRKIPEQVLSQLKLLVKPEECTSDGWLYIAEEPAQRNILAELVAQGDRIQMTDRRFRRELSSWFHPNRSHNKDGIPGYAVGHGDMMSLVGPSIIASNFVLSLSQ